MPPDLSAFVAMSAGSQCRSASDTATVAISSPVAILARYSCASGPPVATNALVASTVVDNTGAGNRLRPVSSITIAIVSAACCGPMTAVCAFGQLNAKRGPKPRPHIP